MIVNKYNQGGGGSGSGMTPQQVQQQIDTSLNPYWDSGETKDYVDEAVSGISLEGYYTSAQTEEAITSKGYASQDQVDEIDEVVAESLNDLQAKIDELSGATPDMSLYTPTSGFSTINGSAITAGGNLVIQGGSGETNLNILAAITSQTEYGAISGSVKTGDLIQVWGVDINGDEEGEYGLFQADRPSPGGGIIWDRIDNADSVLWSNRYYPWMTENDVNPIELSRGSFLISEVEDSVESYNGIGFDGDGKPVITHIVPQYEEGEITGMTREDTPIGAGLPVGYEAADQYSIGENFQIVTVDGKVFGEDLDGVPAFHPFLEGYSDEERGYVIGNWCYVFGYYDGDDNFVPVFLPAGTYAILNTDDSTDTYGKVLNLFYGKIGDEDVIYNSEVYAQDLDSISLKTPLFTISEPTCPTTDDNYYELYLDYTDKPSAQSQIDTLDEVVAESLNDLNERVTVLEVSGGTPSVDLSGYYTSAQTEDAISSALTPYYTSAQTNTAISAATQNMVTSTTINAIWGGTQAAYDTLTNSGATADPNTFYVILPSA